MEHQIDLTAIHRCAAEFRAVMDEVHDKEVAVVILDQLGKDRRVAAMEKRNGFGSNSSSDESATEKQLQYMEKLGLDVQPGISKREASALIDQAKEQAA